MNEALVVILAFLWALALLPGAIRSRRRSPRATVGGFQRAMDVLRQRPEGRSLMVLDDPARIVGSPADGAVPAGGAEGRSAGRDVAVGRAARRLRSGRDAMTRRRRLFVRLLVATGVLLVVAVPAGGLVWLLFGVSTLVLVVYAALLRRWKLQRDEARRVVRRLTRGPRGGRESPERNRPAEREPARVAGGGPFTDYAAVRWDRPAGHVRLRQWQR